MNASRSSSLPAGIRPRSSRRRDGAVEEVTRPGTRRGAALPDVRLVDVCFDLAPGETLVLYTDGITSWSSAPIVAGAERAAIPARRVLLALGLKPAAPIPSRRSPLGGAALMTSPGEARPVAGDTGPGSPDPPSRVAAALDGAAHGVVGAMAMTGMRVLTTELGLVEQTPPQAVGQRVRTLLRRAPRRQRRGLIEAAHWTFGAGGGAAFALLPGQVRRQRWAGPVYGLAMWLGFELGIAPGLGLSQAKRVRAVDRVALAGDHLLYGLVLSRTGDRAG